MLVDFQEHMARQRNDASSPFVTARYPTYVPMDQLRIGRPRFGVLLDKTVDLEMLYELTRARPACSFILIAAGPVHVSRLPRARNLHYLGVKLRHELPGYVADWNAVLMPQLRNRWAVGTLTIRDCLLAGKPVVSTSAPGVSLTYAGSDVIWIANAVSDFVTAMDASLHAGTDRENLLHRVNAYLARTSEDRSNAARPEAFDWFWKRAHKNPAPTARREERQPNWKNCADLAAS